MTVLSTSSEIVCTDRSDFQLGVDTVSCTLQNDLLLSDFQNTVTQQIEIIVLVPSSQKAGSMINPNFNITANDPVQIVFLPEVITNVSRIVDLNITATSVSSSVSAGGNLAVQLEIINLGLKIF